MRVIHGLNEGTFDELLQDAGEYYAEDETLITVHPSGAIVIHRCRADERNRWRTIRDPGDISRKCECGWIVDPKHLEIAAAIDRCGK